LEKRSTGHWQADMSGRGKREAIFQGFGGNVGKRGRKRRKKRKEIRGFEGQKIAGGRFQASVSQSINGNSDTFGGDVTFEKKGGAGSSGPALAVQGKMHRGAMRKEGGRRATSRGKWGGGGLKRLEWGHDAQNVKT